jgi:DNA-binding response OmpR family regulator
MNVLLFDRSAYIRNMIQKNLVQFKESMKITSSENISSAVNEIKYFRYDLIILDMDNLDGQFLTFNRTAQDLNSDAIVIMLTSFPNSIIMERFKQQGVDYCLDKTTEFEILLNRIEELLSDLERYHFKPSRHYEELQSWD